MTGSRNEFIEKSIEVHGNFYDYSDVVYETRAKKVVLKCPYHGIFYTTPRNHLKGRGCKQCANEKMRRERSLSSEQVIERFQKVHGYFYDYAQVKCVNFHTKVEIICPKHGIFLMTPNQHLGGKGCKFCYRERRGKELRKDISEVILDFKRVHGELYHYDKDMMEHSFYNTTSLLPVVCSHHGEFLVSYDNHYRRGSNCPECSLNVYKKESDVRVLCFLYFITFEDRKTGCKVDKLGITIKDKIRDRFTAKTKERFNIHVNFAYLGYTNEIVSLERRLLERVKEQAPLDLLPSEILKESKCGYTECFPRGSFDFEIELFRILNTRC